MAMLEIGIQASFAHAGIIASTILIGPEAALWEQQKRRMNEHPPAGVEMAELLFAWSE
jgi:hypothetical protein